MFSLLASLVSFHWIRSSKFGNFTINFSDSFLSFCIFISCWWSVSLLWCKTKKTKSLFFVLLLLFFLFCDAYYNSSIAFNLNAKFIRFFHIFHLTREGLYENIESGNVMENGNGWNNVKLSRKRFNQKLWIVRMMFVARRIIK